VGLLVVPLVSHYCETSVLPVVALESVYNRLGRRLSFFSLLLVGSKLLACIFVIQKGNENRSPLGGSLGKKNC
jgi:hypothetical protein